MDELISTREAASILGVGPTAVKRWADAGEIPCVRTAGGHRRFRRGDLLGLMRGQGASPERVTGPASDEITHWIGTLVNNAEDALYAVESLLLRERARRGAWHRVASVVGEVLVALGAAWSRGEISIVEEHVASANLARAIDRVCANMPTAPSLPSALLVTAADDHTLGLSLVQLCLREAGWRTLWAGRATPAEEVMTYVRAHAVALVATSASSYSTNTAELQRWLEIVGPPCKEHGTELLLGGGGAWPDPPPFGRRIASFAELSSFLAAASGHRPR